MATLPGQRAQFTWALNQYNRSDDPDTQKRFVRAMAKHIAAAPSNSFTIEQVTQGQSYPAAARVSWRRGNACSAFASLQASARSGAISTSGHRRRRSPPDSSIGLNACAPRRVDAIAASLVLARQDWLGNGDSSACARRCGSKYYYVGNQFDPDPSHNLQRGVNCNVQTIFYTCVSGPITAVLEVKSDENEIDSSQTEFSFTLSGPGRSLKSSSPDVNTFGSSFRISGGSVVAWSLRAYRDITNHDWLLQTCYACGSSIAFDNYVETFINYRLRVLEITINSWSGLI
jgi:hypothetical protein